MARDSRTRRSNLRDVLRRVARACIARARRTRADDGRERRRVVVRRSIRRLLRRRIRLCRGRAVHAKRVGRRRGDVRGRAGARRVPATRDFAPPFGGTRRGFGFRARRGFGFFRRRLGTRGCVGDARGGGSASWSFALARGDARRAISRGDGPRARGRGGVGCGASVGARAGCRPRRRAQSALGGVHAVQGGVDGFVGENLRSRVGRREVRGRRRAHVRGATRRTRARTQRDGEAHSRRRRRRDGRRRRIESG